MSRSAFLLSNEGYDVWLGNVRGSKYSMKHSSLDPLSKEFWQFSFHEIGVYDLSAMINYILALTQKPSLFYVGHNQATTALLVLLSNRPDYNTKILNAHLMAPIAFMDYPHPVLSLNVAETLKVSEVLPTYNFQSLVEFTSMIMKTYCPDRTSDNINFCTDLWFTIFGRNLNRTEINPQTLFDIPNYISPSASLNQYHHYLQISQSGKFQSFEARANKMSWQRPSYNYRYSSTAPYNLANVRAPLYLYHAAEDLVVSRLVASSMSRKKFEV
jgi:lysosomal acid lipase/cholesteryl ester hydrolase